jgi:hypothetical protein
LAGLVTRGEGDNASRLEAPGGRAELDCCLFLCFVCSIPPRFADAWRGKTVLKANPKRDFRVAAWVAGGWPRAATLCMFLLFL